MPEIRTGENGSWHIASNPVNGVYIRLHLLGEGVILPRDVARQIANAILEVTDDVHGES